MTAPAAADPSEVREGFVVELDGFSGPLDLLLHLLREQQLEIADIPIARIADQFLQAIHQLGLNQAADYLEMASRLVRLKAQMLMPRHSDEEGWEDPRAELVRRLLEYQQVKEIALWMGSAAERRALRYGRGWTAPIPDRPPPPLEIGIGELFLAVDRVLTGIITPVLHRVVARPLDVEGATARLSAMLEVQDRLTWAQVLGHNPSLNLVLSTLLALLEMARRGRLRLLQDGPYQPMVITREATYATA